MYMVDDIVTFAGGESGEWLPLTNCNPGQGIFTTGSAKPGKKQCYWIFFVSSNFSYIGEEFGSWHPNWSWDTSQGKTTSDRHPIHWVLWPLTQPLCPILHPKVTKRTEEWCKYCISWSRPDGVFLPNIQVAVGAREKGMYFGNSFLLRKMFRWWLGGHSCCLQSGDLPWFQSPGRT